MQQQDSTDDEAEGLNNQEEALLDQSAFPHMRGDFPPRSDPPLIEFFRFCCAAFTARQP